MTTKEIAHAIKKSFDVNEIYAYHVACRVDESKLEKSAKEIIESKPKPFVKWVGGKRQLLRQFKDLGLYPPEGFSPLKNIYHEPFVGGGAVFFDLLPKKTILSDTNREFNYV